MAVMTFDHWYDNYQVDERDGTLRNVATGKACDAKLRRFERSKRDMDARLERFELLEKLADGEMISPKADLPNISSGETAGLVRRIARNLVQNAPNVEVISKFQDEDAMGIFSRFILTSKIIASDFYSNDMQQNLFASTKSAFTLGFDCVIPVLLQDAAGGWYMKYDSIHYRDVFPESGCKDVRQAKEVFVRRYLTEGEVRALIDDNTAGWDIAALKTLLQNRPPVREQQSTAHQDKKRGLIPEGYEIITWYSDSGEPFLTWDGRSKMLLRIEKNKHPLKWHPVHFLVLEKDDQQPLGKSQVELLIGRQDFQDLMLNGAMKLWYRNINPSIIAYGTVNASPNLGPGKVTSISNPQARVEPFEVNTQTLMQYGPIAQQNLGAMINLVGSADQQMATQAGNGMSATPQGVEAQQAMVDITTNNYQKAIESFFSHYCSYALTVFFQEMKAVKKVAVTADARKKLAEAGFDLEMIKPDGTLDIDFELLATEYWVQTVPGSLTELEDEKQLRILNQLFVPLSQAMPAMAASGDQQMVAQAAKAMAYIVQKQIELSGSQSAKALGLLMKGEDGMVNERDERIAAAEEAVGALGQATDTELGVHADAIRQLQGQVSQLIQHNADLMQQMGGHSQGSPAPMAEEGQPAPLP